MPLREHGVPQDVISTVLAILRMWHSATDDADKKLWAAQMLTQACRHIEYFVTPVVSVSADQEWRRCGGEGALEVQRYRKPGGWKEGCALHFEHATPVADMKKLLLDLGPDVDLESVRRVLHLAETAWISKEPEELALRTALKTQPKDLPRDWRKVYAAAGISIRP